MGFFDMFKKKEQKSPDNQNKDPLADIFQQTNLPQSNLATVQQTTNQKTNVQQNSRSPLPLPQIPSFNDLTDNKMNVSTSNSIPNIKQEVPSIQSNSSLFMQETKILSTNQSSNVSIQEQVKKDNENDECLKFLDGNSLFIDLEHYKIFYNTLNQSKKTIVGLNKLVGFALVRKNYVSVLEDYYKNMDEINRIVIKIDKKLFND
ncbi:MAG: hypothetical protein QXR30_02000 [Candidatus Woesearchaeota archaeon]